MTEHIRLAVDVHEEIAAVLPQLPLLGAEILVVRQIQHFRQAIYEDLIASAVDRTIALTDDVVDAPPLDHQPASGHISSLSAPRSWRPS